MGSDGGLGCVVCLEGVGGNGSEKKIKNSKSCGCCDVGFAGRGGVWVDSRD